MQLLSMFAFLRFKNTRKPISSLISPKGCTWEGYVEINVSTACPERLGGPVLWLNAHSGDYLLPIKRRYSLSSVLFRHTMTLRFPEASPFDAFYSLVSYTLLGTETWPMAESGATIRSSRPIWSRPGISSYPYLYIYTTATTAVESNCLAILVRLNGLSLLSENDRLSGLRLSEREN